MKKKLTKDRSRSAGTVKKKTLAIALVIGFAFSLVMGITGVSMGLGSLYPQMNLIAKPFVCPGKQMSYQQNSSQIATATYWTAKWYCADEAGTRTVIDNDRVFFSAGVIYGVVVFAILLLITYLYWNSSIGPAKNGGPQLW